MKTDALDIDADGMPLLRSDPAAALRLEQEVLGLQGLEACLEEWASSEDEQAFADL